jgi:hypothetical protein
MSPMHIEELGPDGKGAVDLKIWYDDPENEDPNFGQDGDIIDYDAKSEYPGGRDAWLAQMHTHLQTLKAQALERLGPGKVYEIRSKIPTDFGRSLGVAWYTIKAMQALELVDEKPYPGVYNELGGYFFMGRFKT